MNKFILVVEKKMNFGKQKYLIIENGEIISESSGEFSDFYEISKSSFSRLEIKFVNDLKKFKENKNDNI